MTTSDLVERTRNLPQNRDVGTSGEWTIPTDANGTQRTINGRFLGIGSSFQPEHGDHLGEFAVPGERCHMCRWFESRIFRLDGESDGGYLILNIGQTTVPGEKVRIRAETAQTGFEVLEILITRRRGATPTLSIPAARVLSQAAGFDASIKEAYVERATA